MTIQTDPKFQSSLERLPCQLLREPASCAAGVAASLLLLMSPAPAGGQTNDVPAGWTFLNLEEAVVVINELTPLQLNLECAAWTPPERVALPLKRASNDHFTNVTVEAVQSLFASVENYTWTGSNGIFTLVPKELPAGRPRHLDYVVPNYRMGRTNLFRALWALCQTVPFTLEIIQPVVASKNIEPDLTSGYPHWDLAEMPSVNAALTNCTVREILIDLVNSQKSPQKLYWITQPPFEASAKLLGTNANSVTMVSVRHAKESRKVHILRDPNDDAVHSLLADYKAYENHPAERLAAIRSLKQSNRPFAIFQLARDLDRPEPVQDVLLKNGLRVQPYSVSSAEIIRSILTNAPQFSAEVKNWAAQLDVRDSEALRSVMRDWWLANAEAFKQQSYSSVKPGKTTPLKK